MTLLGAIKVRDWETSFLAWAKPPSDTEQERCDRALTAIRKAVAANSTLTARGVDVFAQGSYANRTNVRQDSDVDVCIRCRDIFFPIYPANMTPANVGNTASTYSYAQFRNDVGAALVSYFGKDHVSRGKKAFDIHENSYRVDSDAVASFGYRQYFWNAQGLIQYYEGIGLVPDGSTAHITNFPQHQYNNGVAKNDATSRRFKALTRIVKTLRNDMADNGYAAADPIASFLIECLVWNWPTPKFDAPSWRDMALRFFTDAWNATRTDQGCAHWMEENNIKRLFGPHNGWTREQVNAFASAAYFYIGGK